MLKPIAIATGLLLAGQTAHAAAYDDALPPTERATTRLR